MRTNDVAGKALDETQQTGLAYMIMSRMKRGETLRMDDINGRLMQRLRDRSAQIEGGDSPKSVTDWMALVLFAEDRESLHRRCQQAEAAQDKAFAQASYWLRPMMHKRDEYLQQKQRKNGEV